MVNPIRAAVLGLLALLPVVAGCTSTTHPVAVSPSGRVPVAVPPVAVLDPPTGQPGSFALVAMGSPVVAIHLPLDNTATVTARGPVLAEQGLGVAHESAGTMTVTFHVSAAPLTIDQKDFVSRNVDNAPVALTVTPTSAVATPGKDATIEIRGTFPAGRAYLTWQVQRRPTATWTFDVELD